MPVVSSIRITKIAAIATLGTSLLSCTPSPPSGLVKVDGSSTVFPITEAIAQSYNQAEGSQVKVTTEISGTGGGFEKFCAGETDINDASRPISQAEMAQCDRSGIRYIELPIAFDALTVVVNPNNTWAKDITVSELKTIWESAAQGKITRWQQVRSAWPNQPLRLFGPGQDSGTFDYFREVVIGKDGGIRTDYVASEDDDTLVQGVEQDPNALGYFGFAYYDAEKSKLTALAVDGGKGPVLPSRKAVENAQYQPLARPLFIYVNVKAAQDKPQVQSFVEFYLKNASQGVSKVGYIPLPAEGYRLASIHFEKGKVGTVFGGQPQPELTLVELLRKQATF
jgi:phosphate transport system substrate-binding protein